MLPQMHTFLAGKLVSGFWGFVVLFFVMMYNSNLRFQIILPLYQHEINGDEDIIKYDVKTVYNVSEN